jgi:hypothetical protein
MTRTATHIRESPNPAQLEMRILANHGSDGRFAFLRGRWKRAWARIRAGGRAGVVIGGLAGYASDSASEGEIEVAGPVISEVPVADEAGMDRVRAERRARAQEWTRRRREGT